MRQGWRIYALLLVLPFLLVLHGVRSTAPPGNWGNPAAEATSTHGSSATQPGLSSDVPGVLTAAPARAGASPSRVGTGGPAAEPARAVTVNPADGSPALVDSPGQRLLSARVNDRIRGRAPPRLPASPSPL